MMEKVCRAKESALMKIMLYKTENEHFKNK